MVPQLLPYSPPSESNSASLLFCSGAAIFNKKSVTRLSVKFDHSSFRTVSSRASSSVSGLYVCAAIAEVSLGMMFCDLA